MRQTQLLYTFIDTWHSTLPAWVTDNMADDFFLPGHCLCPQNVTDTWWRNIKAHLI